MSSFRNLLLVVCLLMVSFPALADGLSSLSVAFERLVILSAWLLGSVVLLIISLIRFRRKKSVGRSLAVYGSFLILSSFYIFIFCRFMDMSGSLISDDTIHTNDRDAEILNYRTLLVLGCLLATGIAAFACYHGISTTEKGRSGSGKNPTRRSS